MKVLSIKQKRFALDAYAEAAVDVANALASAADKSASGLLMPLWERMGIVMESNLENGSGCCHCKATPREEKELKQLKNRISRMVGQLNGIGKMLDENRYCGDVLIQVAAVESALQSFAYLILQEHMETCVVEEIKKGNTAVIAETVELVKKLQ